ncbi:hypothetical protein CH063_03817, partial [Colletotrichum higginsianum]
MDFQLTPTPICFGQQDIGYNKAIVSSRSSEKPDPWKNGTGSSTAGDVLLLHGTLAFNHGEPWKCCQTKKDCTMQTLEVAEHCPAGVRFS